MIVEFTVVSNMKLSVGEDLKAKLHELRYRLECGNTVDASKYYDPSGQCNINGQRVISQVLIHALSGNIHAAHQRGQRDSAEHLRWAISELEKAFVENFSVELEDLNIQKP